MKSTKNIKNNIKQETDNNKYIIMSIGLLIIGVIILICAKKMFTTEFSYFFNWWIVLLTLGIVFFPLSAWLFKGFNDMGWLFSKVIGIAVSGWLIWLFSSIKILKFSFSGCIVCVGLCLIGNVLLMFFKCRSDKKIKKINDLYENTYSFNCKKLTAIIAAEIIFLLLFVLWTYLKGFKPEAYGTTEKMMDYGFMNAIMKSDYMPPEDIWLAGKPINYYYVGQFIATYLSKLTGAGVEYGYNLMLMTLAAFGFSLPYSIVHNIAGDYTKSRYGRSTVIKSVFPKMAGTVAGIAVSLAGNMQYVIYSMFIPWCRTMLGIDKLAEAAEFTFPGYWFPDATRYIGYFPETSDKTIHEFPLYSFVLGDLHAHVLNIMFVLIVVALLYAWLKQRQRTMDEARISGIFANGNKKKSGTIWGIPDFAREVFNPIIILTGFFIGLFHTTNFWDYPIYFVVAGAVILFSNAVIYNFSIITLKLTAIHGLLILLIAKLICIPFTLSFNQISTSINLTVNRTPIYQLVILWGLPVACVIFYFFVLVKKQKIAGVFNDKSKDKLGKNVALFRFIGNLDITEMFIIIIGLCAIGLILIPEIVYVKDIYSGDYKRANTMFKLTYQAYILFGMAMGYILIKLLFFSRTKKQRGFAVIASFLFILTIGYFFNSTKAWFGDYFDKENYKCLDASAFLEKENIDDYKAVKWINSNIEGRPVLLEVNGDSYTYYNRISVMTGLPTVLGWKTHEWLWQSDASSDIPEIVVEREKDIKTIYTSDNENEVKRLIEQYNIQYIYMGKLEREKYDEPENHKLLQSLGTVVYPASFTMADCYDTTYIIKIENSD